MLLIVLNGIEADLVNLIEGRRWKKRCASFGRAVTTPFRWRIYAQNWGLRRQVSMRRLEAKRSWFKRQSSFTAKRQDSAPPLLLQPVPMLVKQSVRCCRLPWTRFLRQMRLEAAY